MEQLDRSNLPDEPTVISRQPPILVPGQPGSIASHELGRSLLGRRLAHYQLDEFVGGGGMGAVFRATDTMLNRVVAVKVLSRDQGRDDDTVKRFQNEAQSAARLDHDNIARVYYVGKDDGWNFIVFEYIEGKNLREIVLERGPLPWQEAVQVTLQLAEAIDHASHREVVHRDIKPSNVLLTTTGKAKLVDMGLARLLPIHGVPGDLTASGVTLGTFDYISPEQARDPRTADTRSDIYSLGCTLFYMLTGHPVFPDGTVLQKLMSHTADAPPDPRQERPDLPADLTPIVHRMLAKRPAERYQSPAELIGDLLVLADRHGLALQTRVEPIWIAPEPNGLERLRPHLPWLVALVLFGLAALALDPLLSSRHPGDSVEPPFRMPTQPTGDRVQPSTAPRPNGVSEGRVPEAGAVPAGSGAGSLDASPVVPQPSSPLSNPPPTAPARGQEEGAELSETRDAEAGERPNGLLDARGTFVPAGTLVVDASLPADTSLAVVADLPTALRRVADDASLETIQIRHQGRLELPPLSIALPGRRLRLVAANGYTPVLAFRVDPQPARLDRGAFADSVAPSGEARPASTEPMVRIRGGELEMQGLHWELVVPPETLGGEWSLFQLTEAPQLRLQDCSITIQNSYGGRFGNLDDVAFFDCVAAPRDGKRIRADAAARPVVGLELVNCVLRGEATGLLIHEATPVRLEWNNGLLVTSERLAHLGGDRERPADGEQFDLRLHHVTAVADQGLLELVNSTSHPFLLPTTVDCQQCVLVTQRWHPLVLQSGSGAASVFRDQLRYRGRGNDYSGMETFWEVRPRGMAEVDSLDFEAWRTRWNEPQSRWQQVQWRFPVDKNRPLHGHHASDYTLAIPDSGMPTPVDRAARGLVASDLPRLPEPETDAPRRTRPRFQF